MCKKSRVYFLVLIPIIGFFIAWIYSWFTIYKITKGIKYVFLHFVFWIIPLCLAGSLIVAYFMMGVLNQNEFLKMIIGIIVSYVAILIMSISSISISKVIIEAYNKKAI